MIKCSLLSATVAMMLSATSASAIVVGGSVTGGDALTSGGVFTILDPQTGFTVGNDSFDSPNLFAFKEGQNATANKTFSVDFGSDLTSGQMFSSHYVFYDPKIKGTQSGYVDFDAPIIGIASSEANLAATDIFSHNKVTYVMGAARGIEGGDSVSVNASNPSRLMVNWKASSPGDYLRVFTQSSANPAAVPVPAGLALMLTAIGGLGLFRKKA